MAGKLFDLFKGPPELKEGDKHLLEVAGLLHDIGVSTGSDEDHNEMSYRLLRENHLAELNQFFDNSAVETILWLVFYHRKKLKDPINDERIPESVKSRVRKLAALLRLADGFDKGLNQCVGDLSAEFLEDKVKLFVKPKNMERSIDFDIHGAIKKRKLLEELLGQRIEIEKENKERYKN